MGAAEPQKDSSDRFDGKVSGSVNAAFSVRTFLWAPQACLF